MAPAGCTTLLVDTLIVCLEVGTSTHGAEKESSDLLCDKWLVMEARSCFVDDVGLLTLHYVLIVQCDAATVKDFLPI